MNSLSDREKDAYDERVVEKWKRELVFSGDGEPTRLCDFTCECGKSVLDEPPPLGSDSRWTCGRRLLRYTSEAEDWLMGKAESSDRVTATAGSDTARAGSDAENLRPNSFPADTPNTAAPFTPGPTCMANAAVQGQQARLYGQTTPTERRISLSPNTELGRTDM